MRFTIEDEDAYYGARDELVDRFAAWARRQGVRAEPSDVELLLDWRFTYGDRVLDVWTVADVEEFLLEWCPRKYSADPDDVEGLPGSVSTWVDFLAHEGLLAGGDPPSVIRKFCAGIGARFRAAMSDPRNFGMAKSLFSGGGLPSTAVELPKSVGPVRLPRPEEIAETVRVGQAVRTARALAQFCAPPGRKLTAKGNLRVADARAAAAELGTGEAERAAHIRSADDLPGVSTWVRLGLAAGVVRRHNGRLVAVARFAKLDDVEAHAALVRAEFAAVLAGDDGDLMTSVDAEVTDHLFAMLLDEPVDGVDLVDLAVEVLASRFPVGMEVVRALVPSVIGRVTDVLRGLDLLTVELMTCDDCPNDHPMFDLTAAGVPHAVERVRAAGVEVTVLPEPAEASATELVAGIAASGPGFAADVAVWLAAQPDAVAAVDELGAAIVADERDPAEVMLALVLLADAALPGLPEAVHRHHRGAHEGLLLPWLIEHGQIDGTTVDPVQLIRSAVDVAVVLIDIGNADDAIDVFSGPEPLPMLREIWRIDHPRLAEVLELTGRRHPVKAVAKEARRSLMKLRSRQG